MRVRRSGRGKKTWWYVVILGCREVIDVLVGDLLFVDGLFFDSG